jgi:hypothetical protein
MKRKICLALLALSSGLMMVLAVEVDKCAEKFNSCKEVCENDKVRCKVRGNNIEYCNNGLNQCNADCNKKLKECQAKSPATAPAKPPTKVPPKK